MLEFLSKNNEFDLSKLLRLDQLEIILTQVFITLFRIVAFTDVCLEYLNWEGLEEWLEYIAEAFPDNTEVGFNTFIIYYNTIPPSGRV